MKTFKRSLSLLTAFAALSLVHATPVAATDSFCTPNPIYSFMVHTIDEFYVEIWVGGFTDGHGPDDVDQGSIIVNGNLIPASVEVAEHAVFDGNALKIKVDMVEFLPPYGKLWDSQIMNYTVIGDFSDEAPFLVEGAFTAIGLNSGDLNGDGQANISDLNFMVNDFFRGGPSPAILATGDVDGSCGAPNMRDLNYMVNFIFRGGPNPTHCSQ